MKVDLKTELVGFDGKVMEDAGSREKVILQKIIYISLNSPSANQKDTKEELFKTGALLNKIMNNDSVDLSTDEIVKIKTAIGAVYSVPELIWSAFTILEGKKKKPVPIKTQGTNKKDGNTGKA